MEHLFFDMKDLKYCGENVIVGKTVRIRKPHLVSLGDNVIIDDFTYIACALEVGPYCHIASNTNFIGGPGLVTIGAFAGVSAGSCIITGNSDYLGGGLSMPSIPEEYSQGNSRIEPVVISDYVLLGCNTVVMPGVHLPEGLATGAFTLLNKKQYEPWSLYIGAPCRLYSKRDSERLKRDGEELLKTKR